MGMVEEAINSFKITPPLAIVENQEINKLKQFCMERATVFVHLSFYKTLKVAYPWDIGGLSLDVSIKNEMVHGPMGMAIGVLSPTMYRPDSQP